MVVGNGDSTRGSPRLFWAQRLVALLPCGGCHSDGSGAVGVHDDVVACRILLVMLAVFRVSNRRNRSDGITTATVCGRVVMRMMVVMVMIIEELVRGCRRILHGC